jgi:hypothetical protein
LQRERKRFHGLHDVIFSEHATADAWLQELFGAGIAEKASAKDDGCFRYASSSRRRQRVLTQITGLCEMLSTRSCAVAIDFTGEEGRHR